MNKYLFPYASFDNTISVLVKFRFVVFHPFVDEVLTGRIRSCNHEGVQGITHCVIVRVRKFIVECFLVLLQDIKKQAAPQESAAP